MTQKMQDGKDGEDKVVDASALSISLTWMVADQDASLVPSEIFALPQEEQDS